MTKEERINQPDGPIYFSDFGLSTYKPVRASQFHAQPLEGGEVRETTEGEKYKPVRAVRYFS